MQHPGRNAPSSLDDAATWLRAGMDATRCGRLSLPELRNLERDILRKGFAAQGRVFAQDPTLNMGRRQSHGEHCVAFEPASGCWWKTTHPGTCGVGVEFHYDAIPPFRIHAVTARELLPSEYIDRLILHNHEFGDDIRLEGFVDADQPSVTISQPDISGSPATAGQMAAQMHEFGYLSIPDLHVGKAGSISFYHPTKHIALFDAHPGNFFHTNGSTLPVDGILKKILNPAEHEWLLQHAR